MSKDILNSRFYHKVTISDRKGCDFSSLQQVVKNGLFYGNNRENISRMISKVI